jgi:hypothetical protein
MNRTTGGIIVVAIALIVLLGYLLTQPAPGKGGGGKLIDVNDIIQGDGTTQCSLSTAPLPLNTGDTAIWSQSQALSFTVTFPAGSALNPGTPFTDPLNGGRQTTFTSTGTPVKTGGASLTWWQKLAGDNEFPIQTISVNGNTCYDSGKNPLQPMKVIINQ